MGRNRTIGACGWLATALLAGCYQGADQSHAVGEAAGDGVDDGAGEGADEGGSEGGTGEPGEPGIATRGSLRRLTLAQYRNTVQDLLGDDLQISADLGDVLAHLDDGGEFKSVAAARDGYERPDVEAMFTGTLDTIEPVFADPERRAALLGCAPASADDGCVRAYVGAFGRRAFRRSLDATEIDRYLAVSASATTGLGGDPWTGVRYATAAMLQSPSMLYLPELGEPDPHGFARMRFTSIEMASRLAFALTNRAPDDELLDAGEAGELVDDDELRVQAERMLLDERGRHGITFGLFGEYFNLDALGGLGKDSASYPKWNPAVAEAMREELGRVLDWGIFEQQLTLSELLLNRTTFVDAQLADIYGMPAPSAEGFSRYDIPDDWARVGLLGLGAYLAINAKTHRTAPTLRGRFIVSRLLCETVPAPPPDVPPLPDGDEPTGHQTMREQLAEHRDNPACSGCHNTMDPPGLALESFDGIGAHRENDEGLPLDLTGEINGVAFDGPVELAQVLAADPALRPCLARQLFRYVSGTKEEDAELTDAITALGVATDGDVRELLLELVVSDAFRYFHAQP
jgi:Protein of unknown function (DUF1592)/Protein of unknown function (DUF1588)/Protein of unknown function (DUF1595)/Protein of unknown function (DUF1585)/Protein of unknown function (DUF1587)